MDDDNDYTPDTTDACPRLAGSSYEGCPESVPSVSLRRKRSNLVGRVSGEPACYAGVRVKIFCTRSSGTRRVATVLTSSTGKFTYRHPTWGKHKASIDYRVVPNVVVCYDDESPKVRIY